jgi:signal transduction histidine kinase
MNAVRLFSLLVYTFGVFAYGVLVVLWARETGRSGWVVARVGRSVAPRLDLLSGALFLLSFLWFLDNVLLILVDLVPGPHSGVIDLAQLWFAFAFPPVIMHLTYSEVCCARPGRRPIARAVVWITYAVTQGVSLFSIAVFYGLIGVTQRTFSAVANYTLTASFVAAAAFSIAMIVRNAGPEANRRQRHGRWGMVGLFGVMLVLFVVMLLLSGTGAPRDVVAGALEIASRSLPLMFMFVGTYFHNRYGFFDLFVKRGASFLLTIGALTAYFALVRPLLQPFEASWAAPWIYAVTLLPVVGALVWLYRGIAHVLDRRWLGRRYTPVTAIKRFIGALQGATTEAQIVEGAERALADIFGARASVRLADDAPPPPFAIEQDMPVGRPAERRARFLLGARDIDAPYFDTDVALLATLADVFASVLDNLQLQQRKLEQEQLARELSLSASRSELKALRAQINPHFLFNALNAIAGLIHLNPANADRTIEQLAEVFRYALRGSSNEWAVLGDELDFVRAYLDVERARFGERLRIDVRTADGAERALIPTMIVQTLVENAVKHGVGDVLGTALVEVDARRDGDRIIVSVTDNGPGFTAPSRRSSPKRGGGYGLENIRQRLAGYFGDNAALAVSRDEEHGMTIVSVTLPFTCDELPVGAGSPPSSTS